MKFKFVKKLKTVIFLVFTLISICTITFATSVNQENDTQEEELAIILYSFAMFLLYTSHWNEV